MEEVLQDGCESEDREHGEAGFSLASQKIYINFITERCLIAGKVVLEAETKAD